MKRYYVRMFTDGNKPWAIDSYPTSSLRKCVKDAGDIMREYAAFSGPVLMEIVKAKNTIVGPGDDIDIESMDNHEFKRLLEEA